MRSYTSVLALSCGKFGILATESRSCMPDGFVLSDEINKMGKIYPGIWVGFSGSGLSCSYLQDQLPDHMSNVLPDPTSLSQVAQEIANFMNHEDNLKGIEIGVTVTLIGRVASATFFEVLTIEMYADKVYYFKQGSNYTCAGSGTFVLKVLEALTGFNPQNMTYLDAAMFAARAIYSATQLDWCSGGQIRVTILLPERIEAQILWTQENFKDCRDRYYIRMGPVIV